MWMSTSGAASGHSFGSRRYRGITAMRLASLALRSTARTSTAPGTAMISSAARLTTAARLARNRRQASCQRLRPLMSCCTGALMLAITLVFALVGAMPSFSKGVQEGLREKAGTGSRASGRLRNALLVSEVAFAVVLLVGASLLGQTWNHLAQAKPGFDTSERVVAARITPLAAAYPTPQGRAAFFTQLLQRLAAAPGIESAGLAHRLPLDGNSGMTFSIPGRAAQSGEASPMVNYRSVTNGYFTAMGIPLQQGRLFSEKELAEKSGVLLVNRAFASRYFPGEEVVDIAAI